MLCEKCKEREARIHITQIVDGHMMKCDFCEECAGDVTQSLHHVPEIAALLSSHKRIKEIVARDRRYGIEAYVFVREAVGRALTTKGVDAQVIPRPRVSGKELLEAIRRCALLRFGKDAKRRLNEWGVKSCDDFGEIVFNLVDAGLLGKQQSDRKEYFQGGYNFDEAFPES
jgi:uncharacterized repeat protein (TIGR04138 family)